MGYIGLDQARVQAIEHARDHTDFYGPSYASLRLAWEVLSTEDSEDHYEVRLSYRPAGRFRGQPGVEQFIFDKTGALRVRQILDEPLELLWPLRRRPPLLLLSAVGLILIVLVALATLFGTGAFDSNGSSPLAAPSSPGTAVPLDPASPTEVKRSVPPGAAPATPPADRKSQATTFQINGGGKAREAANSSSLKPYRWM